MTIEGREYYKPGNIEAWDVIEDWELNFNLGNVIKYVARAGLKADNTTQGDLEKALTYLEREVGRFYEGGVGDSPNTVNTRTSET